MMFFPRIPSNVLCIENELDLKPNYNGAMKEVVTYKTSMSFAAEAVENEDDNYKKRKNSFTLVFSGKLSPFTGMLRTQINQGVCIPQV